MTKKYDFTTGNIFKLMILFSSPIFLTNLLQTSYQFIDSVWVGQLLGANALAAISISSIIVFTILSFIIGINASILTILSQQKGKKDYNALKETLNAFVVTLTILSITFGIIGYFSSEWILTLLKTPKNILPLANGYLQITFLGIPLLFGYNFIGTVLRALGDSKTPIRFVFIAVILNTILDPVFISVLKLGIEGAAYSTIFSQGIAFLYGLIYSIKKANVPFTFFKKPIKKHVKRIFKLGLPAGLQMIVVSGGMLAVMGIVTSFGENVVAGFGAAQRLDSLIMLPSFTLGSAINSMAGQNIGAGKWERVNEIAKKGTFLVFGVMLTISTIVFFASEHLILMFIQDTETVSFGVLYLKTVAFFYPFLGINFALNGIMRANGAMLQVLTLSFISFWLLRFPLTKLFSTFYGDFGIGLGMGISLVASSIISLLYYKFGNWKNIKI